MNMCIELVELNETYGVNHWFDRSGLFGISEEKDKVLIKNMKSLFELYRIGENVGFYNFTNFNETSGKYKCYNIVFCDDLEVIKTFYHKEVYLDYSESTKQLAEMCNWSYNDAKILPADISNTVDLTNLSFEIIDDLWNKTVPISPPVIEVF